LANSISKKRAQNEKKFKHWEKLSDGGRRYTLEIAGRSGWKARYIKEVNAKEETVRFYQEIHNDKGRLVEIHEKYPEDKGHQKVKR
jgi:hypothetical protein